MSQERHDIPFASAPDQEHQTSCTKGNDAENRQRLLKSLMRELFQTEHSAQRHPRVEARRLGTSPPARALDAVARHADAVLEELPIRARHHNLPVSIAGLWVGDMFSKLRQGAIDLLVDVETSYRGTLLGMRHGLDVMRMLRETAAAADDPELAEWCERILKAREPLIEECAQELAWFAQHSQQAMTGVSTQLLLRGWQLLKSYRSRTQGRTHSQEPARANAASG